MNLASQGLASLGSLLPGFVDCGSSFDLYSAGGSRGGDRTALEVCTVKDAELDRDGGSDLICLPIDMPLTMFRGIWMAHLSYSARI